MTRPELDRWLSGLHDRLPTMRQQHPHDSDFWAAFSRETGRLSQAELSTEDATWVQDRIVALLAAD